jgi:Rap1a immunity proteins
MPDLLTRVCSARRPILVPAIIGAVSVASLGAMAATPDTFQVRTTSDLVTLCSVDPAAPDYSMAISFCHGFAVGAYQYHSQTVGASSASRFVCLPNPPPTRSQAIADFVAWARARPETMNAPPVDALFRHLSERYPCRS